MCTCKKLSRRNSIPLLKIREKLLNFEEKLRELLIYSDSFGSLS